MAGLGRRIVNFLLGEDEAINSLWGGSPKESISGTVGRAAEGGKWWAVWIAQPLINLIMFNPRHCQEAAAAEAKVRQQTGGAA
jgi:hypothetical protein